MISWKGEMKVDLQIEEAESKRQKHFSFVPALQHSINVKR